MPEINVFDGHCDTVLMCHLFGGGFARNGYHVDLERAGQYRPARSRSSWPLFSASASPRTRQREMVSQCASKRAREVFKGASSAKKRSPDR